MGETTGKVKLKYGTATKIATRLGLSVPHVTLVLRGHRKPGRKLARAIQREIEKQQAA